MENECHDGLICKMEIMAPFRYLSFREMVRDNGCFREPLKNHYRNTEFYSIDLGVCPLKAIKAERAGHRRTQYDT